MRPLLFSRVWLASALLAASGCVTLADLPPPKDDAGSPAQGDPGQIVSEDSEDPGPDSRHVDAESESPEPEPELDSVKPELDAGPKPGPEPDAGSDAGTDAKVEVDAEICSYPPYAGFLPASPVNCRPPVPPVVECRINADCGLDRFCVDNTCQAHFVCRSSTECSPREDCVDGTCRPQPACQSNDQCGQNRVCLSGACAARCNADDACVVYQGPADRSIKQFATDDNALYFALGAVNEDSSRADGQVWRMVPGESPTLVTDQLGPNMSFAVQNGYAYFRRGATFMRSRVEPDAADQTLYAAPTPDTASWAIGTNFVVFSGYDGFWVGNLDGTMSLHHVVQDTTGTPKEVLPKGDRFHFIGKTRTSDQYELSRIKTVRAVEPFTVEDASPLFATEYESIKDVRAPYAYLSNYWGGRRPARVSLIDGLVEGLPGASEQSPSPTAYTMIGDSLYHFELRDHDNPQRASSHVTRYLVSDWTRKQELMPWRLVSASSAGPTMAVLRDRFYTAKSQLQDVIYEMTLPAAP